MTTATERATAADISERAVFTPTYRFGDLMLQFTMTFKLRWNDKGSGADSDGGFWHPVPPTGYYALGSIGLGNYNDANKRVAALCVREAVSGALAAPIDYTLIWKDSGSGADRDGSCWAPVPPAGYVALGSVFNAGYNKPSLNDVRCVREDLTDLAAVGPAIWLDKGSGAKADFGAWTISCAPYTSDTDKAMIAPNTFIGVANHNRPATGPKIRCLNLPLPVTSGNMPPAPQLTSKAPPASETTPVIDRTVIVPFTAIADPGKTLEWQVNNSPFYSIERLVSYKLVLFDNNETSNMQTQEQQIATGVSHAQTETFSKTTSITVSAEVGVDFGGEGKVSTSITKELGFSKSSTVEMFESETTTRRLNTPPRKAAALWATSYQLRLLRMDGTIVGSVLAFEADVFHEAEYPPEPTA